MVIHKSLTSFFNSREAEDFQANNRILCDIFAGWRSSCCCLVVFLSVHQFGEDLSLVSPRVGPVCVLLSFFLTPLFPWIWASSVTASPSLSVYTYRRVLWRLSCPGRSCSVRTRRSVPGQYYIRRSVRLNIVRNTSDIVRLDLWSVGDSSYNCALQTRCR